MSDTREALARLLMDWGADDESAGRCAAEILAEFLVVPRTALPTEYAAESEPGGHLLLISDRAVAVNDAETRGVLAFSRPVLPWEPITEEER